MSKFLIKSSTIGSICLVLAACKSQLPNVVGLVLLAPATIAPTRATMQVGDTLWVEAAFSDSLLDLNSGHRYRVQPQNLEFVNYFAIRKLFGNGKPSTGIASTFQVVEKIGRAGTGGSTTGQFFLTYDGHTYRTKFGLIPSQPGVTAISLVLTLPDGADGLGKNIPSLVSQLPPDPQGREQKVALENMFYIINEGKANNYNLYRQQFTIDPETTGTDVPPASLIYGRESTFTVEVK